MRVSLAGPFRAPHWLALTLAGLAAGYYALYRRPLPRKQGLVRMEGLERPVEVEWDGRGIPRIRCHSWLDGWRALGWVHAQDRPFQMDLQRRVAWGRLSQIFGPRTLSADKFLRRLGLWRSAEAEWAQADVCERAMLTAYAEGVNAVWKQERRASEFLLLGYRPDPWSPKDAYLWVKCLAHDLASNWEYEALRTLLWQTCGVESLRLWSCHPPAEMPLTGAEGKTLDGLELLLEELQAVKDCLPQGYYPTEPLSGSNAWAVSARRSRDGFPLLANDPHLAMKVPDYWYEVGMEVAEGGVKLFGVGMPGLPGMVLGQNGHLAWGVTNAFIDVQDLYAERIDWSEMGLEGPQGREKLSEHKETIPVRLGKAVEATSYSSPRGALIWGGPDKGPAGLSLAWSGREPGHFFRALARLNASRHLEEAREALSHWHLPVLNFILADRRSIAHQVVGRVPRRRHGSGLVVVPAWDSRWSWSGFLEFGQLPAATDPECGYLISANHAVASTQGHFLSWDFNPGFRAERIEELLLGRDLHDLESFQAIQGDRSSTLARRFLGLLARVKPCGPVQDQAWKLLSNWSGELSPESVEACLYQTWLGVLSERVLEENLPEKTADWLLGRQGFNPLARHNSHATRYQGAIVLACLQEDRRWLTAPRSWDEYLQESFQEALLRLEARFGPDLSQWHWGRLHGLKLPHPLGGLGRLFPSLGPFPCGGDAESPNQTGTSLEKGLPGPVSIGASWRYVVRLSDFACRTAHCPGQSGHPGSPNYRDGLQPWLEGRYHAPLESPPSRRLHLEPEG